MSNFVADLSSLVVIVVAAVILFVLLKGDKTKFSAAVSDCNSNAVPVTSDGMGKTETMSGSANAIMTIDQLKLNPTTNRLEFVAAFPIYKIPTEGIYISRPNGTPGTNVILLSTKTSESYQVSNEHLGIGQDYPGSYFAKDMGSKNGTYLLSEDHKPQPAIGAFTITDKMVVRLGKQWIRFHIHKEKPIFIDDSYDESAAGCSDGSQTIRYRKPLTR